jgi:hypothetical protein
MRLLPVVVTLAALSTLACAGGKKDAPEDTGVVDSGTGNGGNGSGGNGGNGGNGDNGSDTNGGNGEDSQPATWSEVLINFDELRSDQTVDTEYADSLVFEVEGNHHMNSWNYPSYAESPPNTAYTCSSPGGAGVSTDFTIRFTRPVRNFSFVSLGDQTNGPYATADITMEDGSTDTMKLRGDGGSSSGELQDFSAWENVTSIFVHDITDSYSVNIDDLTFELRDP